MYAFPLNISEICMYSFACMCTINRLSRCYRVQSKLHIRLSYRILLSKSGTKRKRREAETDGLCTDGTDSFNRLYRHKDNPDNPAPCITISDTASIAALSIERTKCAHRASQGKHRCVPYKMDSDCPPK